MHPSLLNGQLKNSRGDLETRTLSESSATRGSPRRAPPTSPSTITTAPAKYHKGYLRWDAWFGAPAMSLAPSAGSAFMMSSMSALPTTRSGLPCILNTRALP